MRPEDIPYGLPSVRLADHTIRSHYNDPVMDQIATRKYEYQHIWRDKPSWFWFISLLAEMVELGGALIGLHKGPVELELEEIASIAANWLSKRSR